MLHYPGDASYRQRSSSRLRSQEMNIRNKLNEAFVRAERKSAQAYGRVGGLVMADIPRCRNSMRSSRMLP